MVAEVYAASREHHPVVQHASAIVGLVSDWKDGLNAPVRALIDAAQQELDEAEETLRDLKEELVAKRRDLILKQIDRKVLAGLRKRILEQGYLVEDLQIGLLEATRVAAVPLGSDALALAAHLQRTCVVVRDERGAVFGAIEGDRIPSSRSVAQLAVEISSAANKCDELERLVSEHGPVPEEIVEKVAALRRTLGLIRGEMPVTSRAA